MNGDREPSDYLWDRTGADPEVEQLEQLLGSLAHQPRPLRLPGDPDFKPAEGSPAHPPTSVRKSLRRWPWLAAAAAVLIAAAWFLLRDQGPPPEIVLTAEQEHEVRTIEGGKHGQAIAMPNVGTIALDPGSRLLVKRFGTNGAWFDLERGRMEAFVYAHVEPEFFQVHTKAAECIDLGCKYVLQVDDDQSTHVKVTMGWVAFKFSGIKVYVPREAECRAVRDEGPGTPRFTDCSNALRAAVDRLDALPRSERSRRVEPARAVMAAAANPRDTLCVFHLMTEPDPDPIVQKEAEARLVELVGWPDSVDSKDPKPKHEEWLDFLRKKMWW